MIAWNSSRLRNESGKVIGLLCMGTDITERRELEEKLKQSLMEKEVLLMEINHRAKNNLQIISSLLNFQIMRTDNEKTIELLRETRDRLHAMALIHETLCRQEDVGKIDFRKFLARLFTDITTSYESFQRPIVFESESDDIHLDIKKAINLALIINELVTNSIKYAFPQLPASYIV